VTNKLEQLCPKVTPSEVKLDEEQCTLYTPKTKPDKLKTHSDRRGANRSKENQNLELVTDKEDLQARSKCPKKF